MVTVTGADHPGITGELFAVLAAHDGQVRDVEQVVVRGQLTLSVLTHLDDDPAPLLRALQRRLSRPGQSVRTVVDPPKVPRRASSHVLLLMGRPLTAAPVHALSSRFGAHGINIDAITQVADFPVTGLEMTLTAPDAAVLQQLVAQTATEHPVDIAVQQAGLARRAKRLIVFDVDSTLITGEVIEMLAEHTGTRAEVERITAAAMRGELDFAASLTERVAMLAGLDATVLDEVAGQLQLTEGAATTIATLKQLGYRCGIVSGGFTQVAQALVDELDLDFVAANTLEIAGGRLTGRVVGDIVDRAGKAAALQRFAAAFEVPMSQTVAVGDGANDIDMLSAAGLGIAFNAKPSVAEHADTTVSVPSLEPVLLILGISRTALPAPTPAVIAPVAE
nr:phosphoserine phosphatase SerB [Nakamurella aerolata]